MSGRSVSIFLVAGVSLALAVGASSQTQTTGRITGTVKEPEISRGLSDTHNPNREEKFSVYETHCSFDK